MLIKIGAKVVSRCVAFQMAEVAIPRMLFAEILQRITELRPHLIQRQHDAMKDGVDQPVCRSLVSASVPAP
jgi:hypothetical protein